MKNKMIIMLLCGALCLPLTACENKGSKTVNKVENKVVKEDVKELENIGTWGDLALDISYKIPKAMSGSIVRGTRSFSYLHGHQFSYTDNWNIYVETLLDDKAELEKLPLQIAKEKQTDTYKRIYEEIRWMNIKELSKAEKEKISGYDAVYFESDIIPVEGMSGEIEMEAIGYSLFYKEKPICVYAEVNKEDKKEEKEKVKKYLQFIISTIDDYNGEAFVELNEQADWLSMDYYNDSSSASVEQIMVDEPDFKLFHPDGHQSNGIFRRGLDVLLDYMPGSEDTYGLESKDTKLEDIFSIVTSKNDSNVLPTSGDLVGGTFELTEEATEVKINGIQMLRYAGKTINKYISREDDITYPYGRAFVVYTFKYNEKPYFYQCALWMSMSDVKSGDAWEAVQKLTDINADSFIRTIMTKEQLENVEREE